MENAMIDDLHTRSLTLVIQRVCRGDENFSNQVAFALLEYAADSVLGEAGNGQFERHVTRNRCRIEAIASIAPIPGDEAREGLVAADADGALRDRLLVALDMVEFLIGGEKAGSIATHLGYAPEEAAREVKKQLTEAYEALAGRTKHTAEQWDLQMRQTAVAAHGAAPYEFNKVGATPGAEA